MKFRKNLLVLAGAAAMALSACGGDSSKSLTVCLASEPETLDPALNSAVDGATMLVHLDSGLYRYAQKADGGLELVYDLAESITKAEARVVNHEATGTEGEGDNKKNVYSEVVYEKGTRYTVKLREGLKWSDGSALGADDFIYSWNRAAGADLGADYGYMFEPIADAMWLNDGDAKTAATTMGIAKVDDRTFTIDVPVDVPYFDQLLAFPTYFPVQKAAVEANSERGGWAAEADSFVSCGAYVMASWEHDSNIVLKKNPNYWNADNITMEKLTFALSDDASAMLASFQNDEYELIDDVPTEQMAQLAKDYPDEYKVAGQMGTYYISFNMNSDCTLFSGLSEENKAKVRKALGLFINRKYLIDNVAQGGQHVANAFVSEGLTDADGTAEFVSKNGPDRDGKGYFDKAETDEAYAANVAKAIALLREVGFTYDEANKKFTDSRLAFNYLYNTSAGHKAIGEYIRDALAAYGITMNMKNEEWATFLQTRKKGNYDVARNGWVADYNDPSTFLTLWTSGSGNNDSQFGKGAHETKAIYSADVNRDGVKENNLTWAQSYDALCALAAKETDVAKRFALLHEIEDLLMETGAICPIYYYTDIYMIKSNIKGFFSSPLGYKFFMYATKA